MSCCNACKSCCDPSKSCCDPGKCCNNKCNCSRNCNRKGGDSCANGGGESGGNRGCDCNCSCGSCNCCLKKQCKNGSMFGATCKCVKPPPPSFEPPQPKLCPYLVLPCPEPCVIEAPPEPVKTHKKCGRVDCHDMITGFDLTCNACTMNCPVETYCPVPQSCLPRNSVNCPYRYPHYNWKLINTKDFHSL